MRNLTAVPLRPMMSLYYYHKRKRERERQSGQPHACVLPLSAYTYPACGRECFHVRVIFIALQRETAATRSPLRFRHHHLR